MVRHVYIPLIGLGFSKGFANYAVFFVSAVYHEYWIGVPTGLITFWAFLAMMLQAPIISIQSIFQKKFGFANS
jgi:diacylglycerol O-acyltransferase-1